MHFALSAFDQERSIIAKADSQRVRPAVSSADWDMEPEMSSRTMKRGLTTSVSSLLRPGEQQHPEEAQEKEHAGTGAKPVALRGR